jgi:hypothetical protein
LLTWVDFQSGIRDFISGVIPLLEQSGLRGPVPAVAAIGK